MTSIGNDKQTSRSLKALLIVVALVCAVPGIDSVVRSMQEGDSEPVSFAQGFSLSGASDPFEMLSEAEHNASGYQGELPNELVEEMGVLPDASDMRSDTADGVAGYLVEGDSKTTSKRVDQLMMDKGWSSVALGSLDGATYIKDEGVCRWALVTCTQVGSKTSIVVRYLRARR